MTEQLEGDLKRGELVNQGKLSKQEAEEQAEEWEKVGTGSGCLVVGKERAMMGGVYYHR